MTTGAELDRLSPLDGRYAGELATLAAVFCERALIVRRLEIECNWLLALGELDGAGPDIDADAAAKIAKIATKEAEAPEKIKEIELETKHDVKAVELYLAGKLKELDLGELCPWVHFGCTSWDINNLAYGLMQNEAHNTIVLPALQQIQASLGTMANEYAEVAMLGRTHGQAASPTTLGKELRIFERRLAGEIDKLTGWKFTGKFNGAVGNYNAHRIALPEVDWQKFTGEFVQKLGLMPLQYSTQIEPFEHLVTYCDNLARANRVLLDLAKDASEYIALGYLVQANVGGEVGSSTMPHKINPINFENAEGNLYLANGMLQVLADTLQLSRLQRDLSNSTILRNIGVALGHSVLAHGSLHKGLKRVNAAPEVMNADLDANWQILAEAIQTCLRASGDSTAYAKLLELTRGKDRLNEADYKEIVTKLIAEGELRDKLLALTPQGYLGDAIKLARLNDD